MIDSQSELVHFQEIGKTFLHFLRFVESRDMNEGIAFMHHGKNQPPNDNTLGFGNDRFDLVPVGVRDDRDHFILMHQLPYARDDPDDSASRRADPKASLGYIGRLRFASRLLHVIEHADFMHHMQDAVKRRADDVLVETQSLAAFEEKHGNALVMLQDRLPQRTVAQVRFDDDGNAEGFRQAQGFLLLGFRADLRKVEAMRGARVQVDSVGRFADDFGHEDMREPRGERSIGTAGKAAIEIATVGQVTGQAVEAEDVDDGDDQERAVDFFKLTQIKKAFANFDSVQFIAVYRGRHKENRAFLLAANDFHRNVDLGVVIELPDLQQNLLPLAATQLLMSNDKLVGISHSLPLYAKTDRTESVLSEYMA